MNRNSSSHFSATDNRINIGRSKFNRDSWCKTSMNVGDLVPFYVDEILPGDTFDMKTSVVARMATPIHPVMDNAYLDTYFFFVPSRLVWEHWKEFNGENNVNAWVQTIDYRVPSYRFGASSDGQSYPIEQFSVGDYMGLPIELETLYGYTDGVEVQVLPLRAYQLIWNEWFRDQNLQAPILVNTGDQVTMDEAASLMQLRKVNKFHDYFTSALPAPQKGPAVMIPGLSDMPVSTYAASTVVTGNNYPLYWRNTDGTATGTGDIVSSNGVSAVVAGSVTGATNVFPSNLAANADATAATIDALRTAFQIQKLLWRDGNGGTRYTEILRSHFGVVSPDARQQRPEYLGGKRTPLTVNQVIQQSATLDNTTPLGNVGAVSKTVDSYDGFTKSFTEHGYVIGVCAVRADHTYQQGFNRMWSRFDRFDFYYPELANIGEQPILNKEIVAEGNTTLDNEVFGYQEAWAEYRYRPSYVTGAMRSFHESAGVTFPSLGEWNYADVYVGAPILSAEWIAEPVEFVNRTLAVEGREDDHEMVFADFYFDLKCTRPMPVYSVPGLVDHF